MSLQAPILLTDQHDVASFNCGVEPLNVWFHRHAKRNQASGASRTYVLQDGTEIVGYYSLAAGSVNLGAAPGKVRRNMPDPIPVMVLGRLAVHADHQGKGIGHGLLKDATLRTMHASEIVGIRAIVVHAISADAKQFYLRYGFIESPLHPMTLFLPIDAIRNELSA